MTLVVEIKYIYPSIHLSHLIPLLAHHGLVLRDAHLLAVHDAGAFGAGPVAVVGVLFHVLLAEAGLFFVKRLLLAVTHRLPFVSWKNGKILREKKVKIDYELKFRIRKNLPSYNKKI